MHSKADNTFSCRAGRQRVSVPVLARGGRPAGRRSGLGHRPRRRAPDARRIPCRRPRLLDTLKLLSPGSVPPALAPGLCQHDHVPEREAPVPTGDQAQQLITAPAMADAGALARGGVPARDGAAPSHAGLELRRVPHGLVPARRGPFGNLARARLDPRSSRHFCGRRGVGPGKTFRPGRIRHGPSMYEMEGPCPASPPRLASCLVFAERRAPPAGARYPREGPVSRLLPRSRRRPRVVPVSSGESIITTAASTAQDPAASHFLFFRYPRKAPQRAGSYPHSTAVIHGLFTPIHRFPSVSRRTPQPPVPNARCYVTS